MIVGITTLTSLCFFQVTSTTTSAESPIEYVVDVKRTIPHADEPFTQGLEFALGGNIMYESSGNCPDSRPSFVRAVDPTTGATVRKIGKDVNDTFMEGITNYGGHWFALTYISKEMREYDKDFRLVRRYTYPYVGWGLARSTERGKFMSTNGSEYIHHFTPGKMESATVLRATCLKSSVRELNELEMVDDFLGHGPTLLGNIYGSRVVLALDPMTGHCTGVFSLAGLDSGIGTSGANGIAYNSASKTFYVTGKNWKLMYEVNLMRASGTTGAIDELQEALRTAGKTYDLRNSLTSQGRLISVAVHNALGGQDVQQLSPGHVAI